jgi:hypothetical protein
VRLREARERMQALYPLDQSLWLEWIGDCMAAMVEAADTAGVDYIKHLYQLAAQDYLSLALLEAHLE